MRILYAVAVVVSVGRILPFYVVTGVFWYIVLYNLCSVAALVAAVWLLLQTRPAQAAAVSARA